MYMIHDRPVYLEDLLEGSYDTSRNMHSIIMEEFREYAMDRGYTNDDIEMTGRVNADKPSLFITVWLNKERKFQVTRPGRHIESKMFSIKRWMNNSRLEREKLYDSILKWIFKK